LFPYTLPVRRALLCHATPEIITSVRKKKIEEEEEEFQSYSDTNIGI
jgi:hypothetical protein